MSPVVWVVLLLLISADGSRQLSESEGAGAPNSEIQTTTTGPTMDGNPWESGEGARRHPHDVKIDALLGDSRRLPEEFEKIGEKLHEAWDKFKHLLLSRYTTTTTTSEPPRL